jgi:hypothetical protein
MVRDASMPVGTRLGPYAWGLRCGAEQDPGRCARRPIELEMPVFAKSDHSRLVRSAVEQPRQECGRLLQIVVDDIVE